MPATTRSKTQTKVEDSNGTSKTPVKRKAPDTSSKPAKKAKVLDPDNKKTAPAKKASSSHGETKTTAKQNDTNSSGETVSINRAPVLELWAACVASFLHPKLSWSTCLSIGGAISTITAISKGRSIGTISKPDPQGQASKQEKHEEAQENLDEIHVMQFHLKLKDGFALVGDKPKKANEEQLRKKYDGGYDKVKKTMQDVLQGWKGKDEDLNGRAFHMYEDFRPSVAAGQRGWGKKGVLNLETVKSVVSND